MIQLARGYTAAMDRAVNVWKSPRIKICCITSRREAETAIRGGADALGLVASMPSGPGVIHEDIIARIAAEVPPPIATFLLTSRTSVEGIINHHRQCPTTVIQICDQLSSGSYAELKAALPGVSIVQVIHVTGPESVAAAKAIDGQVGAILLDSGNPALKIKELGGTGRTHDWDVSRRIRQTVSVPVFLAGGLNPDNVAEAFQRVNPFGLDICSGVRTAGTLDKMLLEKFMRAARP